MKLFESTKNKKLVEGFRGFDDLSQAGKQIYLVVKNDSKMLKEIKDLVEKYPTKERFAQAFTQWRRKNYIKLDHKPITKAEEGEISDFLFSELSTKGKLTEAFNASKAMSFVQTTEKEVKDEFARRLKALDNVKGVLGILGANDFVVTVENAAYLQDHAAWVGVRFGGNVDDHKEKAIQKVMGLAAKYASEYIKPKDLRTAPVGANQFDYLIAIKNK